MKFHMFFICWGICVCAPGRISSLNETVPSSSLCFEKNFMWQVMSEVHLCLQSWCKCPGGQPTSPGQRRSCYFIVDDLHWGRAAAAEGEAGWLSSQWAKHLDFGVRANNVADKAAPSTALLLKRYLRCVHTSCAGETSHTSELLLWF